MTEQKFRQHFQNNFNCYADTEKDDIIPAITENGFIDLLRDLNLISDVDIEDLDTQINVLLENTTEEDISTFLNKT
jgi:hypothetical protein